MKDFQHHSRALVSQLWTTSPHDPVTLMVMPSWVSAPRAVRIQPFVALRQE
jgi:hypothetical protein